MTGLLAADSGDAYWLTTEAGDVSAFGSATVTDGDAPEGDVVDIVG